jgi:hypothetical protein
LQHLRIAEQVATGASPRIGNLFMHFWNGRCPRHDRGYAANLAGSVRAHGVDPATMVAEMSRLLTWWRSSTWTVIGGFNFEWAWASGFVAAQFDRFSRVFDQ